MAERTRRRWTWVLAVVGVLAVVAVAVPVGMWSMSGKPEITGVADGAVLHPDRLRDLAVTAEDDIELLVDGEPVETRRDGDHLVLADPTLDEGAHTVTARDAVPLLPDRETTRVFTVDGTPPRLTVDDTEVTSLTEPYTLTGRAVDASALTVDDKVVPLDADGRFSVELPNAPATVKLLARDSAGNTAAHEHQVQVRHPGMRAVHMSAMAWSSPALRDPVLRMAEEGRIDTVQLDIKDEAGEIGYRSNVPLAKQIGATNDHYDAKAVAKQLHDAGVRLVGRLVAFRDPILAEASWASGKRNRVIQTAGGTPWSGSYGEYAFTNFADPEVVAYNVALAEEAAKLGFDDILYDYVRRPEGSLEQMRIPGLKGTPEQAIVDFLATSRDAVRPHGAFLGASVFGIAVDRPTAIAQDIGAMAPVVDYVSPMVYPSHWGPGEFGVANPESQPHDITYRSLKAFVELMKGSGAEVIPWLQAFSMSKTYGPAEVAAQIDAAKKATGVESFLLWNASCRYDNTGLKPKS
ncbi:MAG TPA: putative glycoside hydrolase [Actinophytocola sp.]|nr:putative glycoside hydrolase [Actinophytocola sp.]